MQAAKEKHGKVASTNAAELQQNLEELLDLLILAKRDSNLTIEFRDQNLIDILPEN